MALREHVPKKGLLKQVFINQAGDYRKGMIELIQNAEDGWLMRWAEENVPRRPGETEDEWYRRVESEMKKRSPEELLKGLVIEVEVKGKELRFSDNGRGIYYEEADRVWTEVGPSWKASISTLYGEKGIGRGQVVAMLFDPSIDNIRGNVEVRSHDLWIHDYDLSCSKPGVTFHVDRLEPPMERPGLTWIVRREDREWKDEEIKEYLKKAVPPWAPYTVLFNGKPLHEEREKKWDLVLNTSLWTLYLRETSGEILVRNPYRPIREYNLVYGVSGELSIKVPVQQNMARDDIVSSDPNWERVSKEVKRAILEHLLSKAQRNPKSLTLEQVKGLLWGVEEDFDLRMKARDVKFIPNARGDRYYSLSDLEGKKVWFGKRGDRLTGDAIDQGFIVLPSEFEGLWRIEYLLKGLGASFDNLKFAPVKPPYYREFTAEEETEEERLFTSFWKFVSGTGRSIRVGESTTALAWTDGISYIAFNRKYIPVDAVRRGDWRTVFLETFKTMAHELSHERPDIYEDSHDYDQCKRELEFMEVLVRNFNKLFPEMRLPPDVLQKISALSCQVLEARVEDVDRMLSRKEEMKEKIARVSGSFSIDFEQEAECFEVLDDYYRLEAAVKALGEKVPERLRGEFEELSRIVEKGDLMTCGRRFREKIGPFLASKFRKRLHEDPSDPQEMIKWRKEFCRRFRAYSKGELNDSRLCHFMREAYYYEKVKGSPGSGELFATCVEPNIAMEYTYESMTEKAKELGVPATCRLPPEISSFWARPTRTS
jgi:hypothetical protein